MNGHPLVEVTNVLHRVRSAIVHNECWLSKLLRKFSTFNPMSKRWLGNLIQTPAHIVIVQTLVSWTLPPLPIMMILITRKGLARRSFGPRLIAKSLSSLEEGPQLEGVALHCSWCNLLCKLSIFSCMLLVFFSWERWLPPRDWFPPVCVVCMLAFRSEPTIVGRWTQ